MNTFIAIVLIIGTLLVGGTTPEETEQDKMVQAAYDELAEPENCEHYNEKLKGKELAIQFGIEWSHSDFSDMTYEEFLYKVEFENDEHLLRVAEITFGRECIDVYIDAICYADWYAVWYLDAHNDYGTYRPITGESLSK